MVVTFIKMDNSGRSFLSRSGVGRIRHISVRVLWMQQRVKEKGLIPSHVPSRETLQTWGPNAQQKTEWRSHVFVQSLQHRYF